MLEALGLIPCYQKKDKECDRDINVMLRKTDTDLSETAGEPAKDEVECHLHPEGWKTQTGSGQWFRQQVL